MKRLKSILCLVLVFVTLASFLGVRAFAEVAGDFVVENGVLTAYNGPGGDVVIPDDLGITSMGDNVFNQREDIPSVTIPYGVTSINGFSGCKLSSVIIPDSVTVICENAFAECSYLSSINMPNSVAFIGSYAFEGCGLKSVVIPDSVTSLNSQAFGSCGILETAVLPSGLSKIEKEMFVGCRSLKSITIPEGVTQIGEYAFSDSGLESVTIPSNVTSIGNRAFYCCKNLKSITLQNEDVTIGSFAFSYAGLEQPLLINNKCTLCYVPSSYTSYKIPDSVKVIGAGAFSCGKLVSVEIPYGVTTIGDCAFSQCFDLTSADIPESVTTIGNSAFLECKSLKSIKIPKGLTSLGEMAFSCSAIEMPIVLLGGTLLAHVPLAVTEYKVPDTVTKINGGAFEQCAALTSVMIPESVTSIGASAFSGCTNLKTVNLPQSLRSIGDFAFSYTGITEVKIPDGITSIGRGVFSSCKSLTLVSLPDGITAIPAGILSFCESLKTLTLPDSVTSIGESAFYCCRSLTSLTLPMGVNSIGGSAFDYCSSLTAFSIPKNVSTLGALTFGACSKLKALIIPESVTSIDKMTFYATPYVTIYGVKGSYAESFASAQNMRFCPLTSSAAATLSSITVDGKAVGFEAYNFDDSNYFKLRDLAMTLNGTGKQFEVGYNSKSDTITLTSGKAYTPVGGELTAGSNYSAAASINLAVVYLDGVEYTLQAYNIGGYNYVKLRDLAAVINFGVTYYAATDSIAINTAVGYTA